MYANIPTQGATHAHIHMHTPPSLSAICSNVAAVIKGVTARQVEVMIMGRSYFCSPPSCSWALCLLPPSLSLAHIFLFFTAKHSPLVQVGPKCSSAHTPTHACLSPYTHSFFLSLPLHLFLESLTPYHSFSHLSKLHFLCSLCLFWRCLYRYK